MAGITEPRKGEKVFGKAKLPKYGYPTVHDLQVRRYSVFRSRYPRDLASTG